MDQALQAPHPFVGMTGTEVAALYGGTPDTRWADGKSEPNKYSDSQILDYLQDTGRVRCTRAELAREMTDAGYRKGTAGLLPPERDPFHLTRGTTGDGHWVVDATATVAPIGSAVPWDEGRWLRERDAELAAKAAADAAAKGGKS